MGKKKSSAAAHVENLIRDRVVRMERMRAGDVRKNPRNFRTHPKAQAEAQLAVMQRVGFAGALLAYHPDDGGALMLIDGHLRQELTPDDTVPVLVLDVNDDEAAQILASYDALGSLAGTDRDMLAGLMAGPAVGGLLEAAPGLSDALAKLLDATAGDVVEPIEPPVLDSAEGKPFRQMTFTIHESQVETVISAIRAARGSADNSGPNHNSNGNALVRVCQEFLSEQQFNEPE